MTNRRFCWGLRQASWPIVFGALLVPLRAHARSKDAALPTTPVFVSVHAGSRSFVVFDNEQRRVAECAGDCQFWAWPATYRVRLVQTENDPETSVRLRIRRPGNFVLEMGDPQLRDAGLVLGVVGSVASVVGTAMMLAGVISTNCAGADSASGGGTNCNAPPVVYYGLGTLLVGTAMTATGFVLFGSNHTGFHFDGSAVERPITARIGPVPLPRGAVGLGATVSF